METSRSTAKRPQVRRLVRQPRGFAQGHATGAAGQRDATGRRDLGLGDTEKNPWESRSKMEVQMVKSLANDGNMMGNWSENDRKNMEKHWTIMEHNGQ